jgi:hypothetical protein
MIKGGSFNFHHERDSTTEYRNETGHKPASLPKKIERDKQLRTRFESAMDELGRLIEAARPLRV